MGEIQVFSVASQRAKWLADRQAVVASNIANAVTPGFKAKDVVPFAVVLGGAEGGLNRTNPRHLDVAGMDSVTSATAIQIDPTGKTTESGNSVSIERELVKGGQVAGAYSLNTNVIKAFHKMMLMSVRG